MVGVDVAGPGRDRTVAKACAGGAIIDSMVSTQPDASGPVLAFLRKHQDRLRIVKVDSGGLGFHLVTIILNAGFPCEGLNAASSATDKERFANLKAERFWNLRGRLFAGEISGLSDEELTELAAIGYVIDPRGKTAIEDKASVKSALGRSPDHAEALMLALGEPSYEPYRYQPLLIPSRTAVLTGKSYAGYPQGATCTQRDMADDLQGEPSAFISGGSEQMRAISTSRGDFARARWGRLGKRSTW